MTYESREAKDLPSRYSPCVILSQVGIADIPASLEGCALGKAKRLEEYLMQWSKPGGGFVHQLAAELSGAELLKLAQNLLGLFCGLCLSGLYFAWDARLGYSFREKNIES